MSNPSTHQQVADFTHSSNFANVLEQAGCSLLVSTYQAGQLCAFGTHEGKLHVDLHPFALAMGIAVSPRRIWVLDSGRGELVVVDPATGGRETVTAFPGYVRGLSFWGPLAFVGLSRIRETSVFGGLPIAAQKQELKCGIGVVDLRSGRQLASFQFSSVVEEIFAVEVLPGVRCPAIRPPATFGTSEPQEAEIWVSPPPEGNLDRLAPITGPEPISVVSSG